MGGLKGLIRKIKKDKKLNRAVRKLINKEIRKGAQEHLGGMIGPVGGILLKDLRATGFDPEKGLLDQLRVQDAAAGVQ